MSRSLFIESPHLQGSAMPLEALVEQGTQTDVGVVICHPHPLFDGTMHNKVISTVARAAKQAGIGSLRFNFRGVGDSRGEHDHGQGEQDDAASAIAYARDELGWQTILLAGFSFGAGVACLTAPKFTDLLSGLFLIAPAVHHFDAPSTLPFEFETFVYMGDDDEVVPFDEVSHWVNTVTPTPFWSTFSDTGHFFHGRLNPLKEALLHDFAHALGR